MIKQRALINRPNMAHVKKSAMSEAKNFEIDTINDKLAN